MCMYLDVAVFVCACTRTHITLCSKTSLIDAVNEFGERDGGSGGLEISRERGKKIKKRERAQEASIIWRNQIVFLAICLFFSLFFASASRSVPHLQLTPTLTRVHP